MAWKSVLEIDKLASDKDGSLNKLVGLVIKQNGHGLEEIKEKCGSC